MCGITADIQSPTAEIRRGKKKERRKKKPHYENIMVCPIPYRATIISAVQDEKLCRQKGTMICIIVKLYRKFTKVTSSEVLVNVI